MGRFPADAPKARVVSALEALGFRLVREGNHISMRRDHEGTASDTLTIPNQRMIKASTLRTILTRAGIPRDEFLRFYGEN